MIKSRSPYYIEVPYVSPITSVTCFAFIIELSIWQGNKTSTPASPSYSIKVENPEALTGNHKVNISQIVNSYIDFTSQSGTTGLIDGTNQIWVKATIKYQQTSELTYEAPQTQFTQLAIRGYGGGMDGENADVPTDKVLMTGRTFKVYRGGRFIVPIQIDESPAPAPSITITNITDDGGGDYTFTYTSVGTYDTMNFSMKTATQSLLPIESSDVTSPTTINDPTAGIISGAIYAFDIGTSQTVNSNLYTI